MEYIFKISIIVPIYNAENYIKNCIKSVEKQSYKNIELILVNDGSTDKTEEICQKEKQKYSNIKYIKQTNAGEGAARNRGLELAEGEYICFLDSDDELTYNALENMINAMQDVDMVIGGIEKKDKGKFKQYIPKYKTLFNKEQFADTMVYDSYFVNTAWCKLYKSEIIKKNNIRFNKLLYGEDTCFVYSYLYYAKKIRIIDKIVYHVNAIEGSMSLRSVENSWNCMKIIYELGEKIVPSENKELSRLLLLRSIKTSLLLETRISKKSFISTCNQIAEYVEKNNFKFRNIIGLYNKLVVIFLEKQFYSALYFFICLRIKCKL